MKKTVPLAKKMSKEVLLSIPEDQFHHLYLEIKNIIDHFKGKYERDFFLGEFIRKDYDMLLKNRFKVLRRKYGELNYDVLNKDKIVRDLKDKQNDKNSIREFLRLIREKCNLTEYTLTLETIPLIFHAKMERYLKKYKDNELFNVFEEIYDDITLTLDFPVDKKLKHACFTLFLNVWNKLKWGTKFRGPQNLSPIIIYIFFNMKGRNVTIKNITDSININDKDMRQGLKEVIKVYPEYLKKDKKMLALNRIKQIRAKFKLPTQFIANSKAIMERFWPYLSNTTENVIAGTVCVLTIIAMDIKECNYTEICKSVGIVPSAVIYQIKNNLFRRFHITGFQGVAKSKEMIKELIIQNINIKLPESKD